MKANIVVMTGSCILLSISLLYLGAVAQKGPKRRHEGRSNGCARKRTAHHHFPVELLTPSDHCTDSIAGADAVTLDLSSACGEGLGKVLQGSIIDVQWIRHYPSASPL